MALITTSNFNIKNVVLRGRKRAARYDLQRISIYYLDKQNRHADLHIKMPNMMNFGNLKNGFQMHLSPLIACI